MNKIYLITGASRGIGKECAVKMAEHGKTIVLLASKKENCSETEQACKNKGADTYSYGIDLSDTKQIKTLIQEIKKKHGNIDVLINNAGIWDEQNFLKGDMDAWDNALDVNLKSVIHMTRYCVEDMKEDGAVIFIASVASKKTYANGTNYCAGKWGLLGFAGALFEDIKERGIKVSSILPGLVNTDMHKGDSKLIEEKMIQPIDIAQTVEFILAMPSTACPTEITIWPQKNPKKG